MASGHPLVIVSAPRPGLLEERVQAVKAILAASLDIAAAVAVAIGIVGVEGAGGVGDASGVVGVAAVVVIETRGWRCVSNSGGAVIEGVRALYTLVRERASRHVGVSRVTKKNVWRVVSWTRPVTLRTAQVACTKPRRGQGRRWRP
jgi:hypothetical protein